MNNEEYKRLYEDYKDKSLEELKKIALNEDNSFTTEACLAAMDILDDKGVLLEKSTAKEEKTGKIVERITSPVGQAIKIFAVLFLFLAIVCVVAYVVLTKDAYGDNVMPLVAKTFMYILAAAFGFTIIYGFGEIVDRLASIDEKLKK